MVGLISAKWGDMETLLLVFVLGLFIMMIYFVLILPFKSYANKDFNNHSQWEAPGLLPMASTGVTNIFSTHFLEQFIKFKENEVVTARTDFFFYPKQPWLLEESYINGIFLTNKRIILIRFSPFRLKGIKYKIIFFSDIKSVEVVKSEGRITLWKTAGLLRLNLKTGKIYQFILNCRLLSSECVNDYKKIIDFFDKFSVV